MAFSAFYHLRQMAPWLQYALPHQALSRGMGKLAHLRRPWFSQPLIRWFCWRHKIDLEEAKASRLSDYPNFNAFFTRTLRPGARPICPEPEGIASPADGTLLQFGRLEGFDLLQAKRQSLDLVSLLGGSPERVEPFRNAAYLTVYLAPPDYHRIHMPISGHLSEMIHIPGRLFSVGPATAASIPDVFTRNERLVTLFQTENGPFALILIGAMLVGSIQVRWHGTVMPSGARRIHYWSYPDAQDGGTWAFQKGNEVGSFNLGSTVIVLFSGKGLHWHRALQPGQKLHMGQCLGEWSSQWSD